MLELITQQFLLQYDTLGAFLDSGGWVTRWILAACAVLITVALERSWYLWRIYPRVRAAALAQWNARSEHHSWAAQRIRLALISQLRLGLEAGLPVIKVMVPMAPLLGLLGTVMGMLQVFDALAFSRGGDTRAMADGISHAMIATMTGLVVSVLGLFFSHLLGSRVRAEAERLNDLIAPG
ncbi:MotA/TolQ/ExbB proton channel family protein [Panacagrimonas sp.]|uniref:MotA/TolQ/ExbB proton channel family protein n=1 Tax=Panacagrimonas sp. TaxID=2480088 RepID=UPI003B526A42